MTEREEIKSILNYSVYGNEERKIYLKGFMDGTNDTTERYQNSAYKKEYESNLLDKVAEKFLRSFCTYCNQEACDGGMAGTIQECLTIRMMKDVLDDVITEMKEGVSE